jgi:hypothetical protein
VRNGSVVDLQIAPGKVTAMVSGSELYNVAITIKEAAKAHWRAICADCAGGIDSLVELLQGRLSKGVMERLCRQRGGLFPLPSEIRFSCSCPDHASMCKHVAAVLYGVGARLDHKPELLFRLRAVDETELLSGISAALPLSRTAPATGKVLEADDVSALFGLDMAAAPVASATPRGKAAPGTAAARRASAVTLPRATAGGRSPVKPNVAKQELAATKATPARSTARRRAAVRGRAEAVSVASPEPVATPPRNRGRRRAAGGPAGRGQATTTRKSEPKPVKWW